MLSAQRVLLQFLGIMVRIQNNVCGICVCQHVSERVVVCESMFVLRSVLITMVILMVMLIIVLESGFFGVVA